MTSRINCKDVLVLSKRFAHHSVSSGFNRLADYLDCNKVERVPLGRLAKLARKTVHRYWKRDTNLIEYFYQYSDFITEQRALYHLLRHRTRICHVFYGDEQLDLLLKQRRLYKSKLIATFHLPFDRSASRFKSQFTLIDKGIDHFIAVSTCLANDLASLFGESRVTFIPHGIDTIIFNDHTYKKDLSSDLRLLIVGSHMRDLEIIHRLVDYAYYSNWNVSFEFIGHPSSHSAFIGCKNVTLSSDVSEKDLITKYQYADALLLPLKSSTANNSILEALACGTPVITTNVGGVKDYMNMTAGWILPQDNFSALINLINYLRFNRNECTSKRAAARERSLLFSWKNVADQYTNLYELILG